MYNVDQLRENGQVPCVGRKGKGNNYKNRKVIITSKP